MHDSRPSSHTLVASLLHLAFTLQIRFCDIASRAIVSSRTGLFSLDFLRTTIVFVEREEIVSVPDIVRNPIPSTMEWVSASSLLICTSVDIRSS